MDVNNYRHCMSIRMKDNLKDLSKMDQKIFFSISAKICSTKAENKKEAEKLVKKDHPEWFT